MTDVTADFTRLGQPGAEIPITQSEGVSYDLRSLAADGDAPAGGEFDGLVAAVTGGSSGIGLACASLLAKRGARVAVLDLAVDGLPMSLIQTRSIWAFVPSKRSSAGSTFW